MPSQLKFFDFETNQLSDCGSVLQIEFASHDLDWQGVVLEKGSSPHFYPKNVYTPYFYFALALDQDLQWSAGTDKGVAELHTVPGEIWINPPKTPFTHDISETCYFIILAIEEKLFLEACHLDVADKPLTFLNNYNVDDDAIRGIMNLFVLEAKSGGRNGYGYLKNLISLLSTHYIQSYSNYADLISQNLNASKFENHQLQKVEQYIDEHIGQIITVDELAELLHCSKFYFLREFKKLTGITPYQFLLNRRLAEAEKKLLANQSIASIAFDLGFNDQAHFTRVFKKHFGKTPGQFKKA